MNRLKGFTIVELLIVIVVIGILAAISIVAYNGIQDRANNITTTSAASQWVKILRAYEATTGNLPIYASNTNVCLGNDFTANAPYAANECLTGHDWHVSADTAFTNAIADESGATPSSSVLNSVRVGSYEFRGIVYTSNSSGQGIVYAVKRGPENCTIGEHWYSGTSNSVCRVYLKGTPPW